MVDAWPKGDRKSVGFLMGGAMLLNLLLHSREATYSFFRFWKLVVGRCWAVLEGRSIGASLIGC